MNDKSHWTEYIKKMPLMASAIIGLITAIISFILLLQGNFRLSITIIVVVIFVTLFLASLYFAYAKTSPLIEGGKGVFRYEKYRRFALSGLFITPLLFISLLLIPAIRIFVLTGIRNLSPRIEQSNIIQNTTVPTVAPFDNLISEMLKGSKAKETGLEQNCIQFQEWKPIKEILPIPPNGKCLDMQDWGISPQKNGFIFSKEGESEEIRQGVYIPITDNTLIEFNLIIYTLFTPYENNLTNLAFGIIPTNPIDLSLDGQLFYQRESSEDGYPIFAKYQERGEYDRYVSKDGTYLRYNESTLQHIIILLKDGKLFISIDDYPVEGSVYLPYSEKAFWIGYRLPANGKIRAYVSDLIIQQK